MDTGTWTHEYIPLHALELMPAAICFQESYIKCCFFSHEHPDPCTSSLLVTE